MDAAAVGDELEKLRFCLAEAVDRDLCAVTALRQARGVPEHRIAGIKDRCHPHKFQCPAVAENTKVVEMPIRIRQHEIREDLIFQKTSYFQLRQTMCRANMNEMLIGRNSVIFLLGIHNVNRRNKLQRLRCKILADTAVLLACAAGEFDRAIPHMVGKALLFMQHGCQHFIETLLGVRTAVAFEQAARIVDNHPFLDQVALQSSLRRIELRRRSF